MEANSIRVYSFLLLSFIKQHVLEIHLHSCTGRSLVLFHCCGVFHWKNELFIYPLDSRWALEFFSVWGSYEEGCDDRFVHALWWSLAFVSPGITPPWAGCQHHSTGMCWVAGNTAKQFPKWLNQLTRAPAMCETAGSSTFSSTLGLGGAPGF